MARKRNPTSWIDLVAFAALCLLGQCYQVTITSSPQSPIPFDYGSVNLACSISPLPPAPVYYTWTSIYQYWSKPTFVNTTPTATLNVYSYQAPRFPVFYCHVHSGSTLVAERKLTLQLEGYLSYGEYFPMEYTVGDNITLKVEIIDDYISEHIQSFSWFYNNTPVSVCSCSSHHILSNDSKNLTIVNATAVDVGTYEARATSFQIYGYNNELCDSVMVELLEYQAVFAPVTYTVTHKSYGEKLSVKAATISEEHEILNRVNDSSLYNSSYGKLGVESLSYVNIYHNGYLNQSLLSSDAAFYGTNGLQLSVNISNYQDDDSGEYLIIVYTDPYILLYQCGSYEYFELVAFYLSLYSPIWYVEKLRIQTAVAPEVLVVADKESLELGEATTLNCSASSGVPASHVSWIKNGQYLINATSVTIPVSTASNSGNIPPFGEYTCVVYNEFYNSQRSKLIQEKVAVQSLWTVNIEWWNVINVSSMEQNTITNEISAVLVQTMASLCEVCDISTDHFTNSTSDVVHSTTHSAMGIYYTSNFTYSSSDGDVTASTLVALLQQWLLEAEENEVQVDVGEAHLVIYKPCGLMNNSPSSKPLCLASLTGLGIASPSTPGLPPIDSSLNSSQTHTPIVIAGSFLGGLMAGVICTVIAALCSALLCKRFSTQPINNTQTEFEMKDNAAYEEINVGAQPRPMTRPSPGTVDQQQEENVYEMCANV